MIDVLGPAAALDNARELGEVFAAAFRVYDREGADADTSPPISSPPTPHARTSSWSSWRSARKRRAAASVRRSCRR
ncbi:hypothetical protein AB0E69_03010 [Kribbella sp. NPDC026611]|uniref:hypothetical protein n=1 Tax=Kribbella sp. NPDC026611 TaxID=3154911 RepID=UPI0033DAD6BC